jgi:hypothetical protein
MFVELPIQWWGNSVVVSKVVGIDSITVLKLIGTILQVIGSIGPSRIEGGDSSVVCKSSVDSCEISGGAKLDKEYRDCRGHGDGSWCGSVCVNPEVWQTWVG